MGLVVFGALLSLGVIDDESDGGANDRFFYSIYLCCGFFLLVCAKKQRRQARKEDCSLLEFLSGNYEVARWCFDCIKLKL